MQNIQIERYEKEVNIITSIAKDINPFTNIQLADLTASEQTKVIQAICILTATFIKEKTIALPETKLNQEPKTATPDSKLPIDQRLQNLEREVMINALKETYYNQSAAAKLLGISFRQFRYRVGVLGIVVDSLK